MRIAARFISVLLLLVTSYLLQVTSVFAQTPNSYIAPSTNADVPKNLHTWTQNVMVEVMSAMTCQLAGIDPVNPNQKCLGVDQKTGGIGFVENGGGAIGVMNKMIAVLYTPPLHTGDYFNYLAQNFGIAKPVYAQGAGFRGLSPLITLWSAFRNVVYLLFVVVFMIVGLAIMLRIHIDPRTVMTIENQIPKIIIGLLLVTFSFAIAGFLIDMMYVSIHLVYGIMVGIPDVNVTDFEPTRMQGLTPMGAVGGLGSPLPGSTGGINGIVNAGAVSIQDVLKEMVGITRCQNVLHCFNDLFNPINGLTNFVLDPKQANVMNILFNIISLSAGTGLYLKMAVIPTTAGATPIFSDIVNALTSVGKHLGAVAAAEGAYAGTQLLLREFLPWLITYLVIFIALLWALFRLWFELIKAYIFILIDVVFAPFWMLFSLLPGAPIGFGAWLRDMIANLSVFPVTITMFLLGKVFMDYAYQGKDIFVPPLIGNLNDSNLLGSIIGVGIILITPQVVTMMRDYLKAPQFKYTAGIGQAVGVGATAPGRAIGGGLSTAFSPHYDQAGQKMVYPLGATSRFLQFMGILK